MATANPMLSILAFCIASSVLPYRWVYVQTNLQVPKNADMLIELIPRAKRAGYNGIVLADTKLQRLDSVPDWYFANARRLLAKAKENQIDLIPAIWPMGYASAMLGHDVNLIEGMPVQKAPFVVHGSEARPEDESNLLANGGLEQTAQGKLAGLSMQDGPGVSSIPDPQVKHEGAQSIRMENFHQGNEAGNARLVWTVPVRPHRQYRISAWVKTQDLRGYVQVTALDETGRSLTINDLPLTGTRDWSQIQMSFNSLQNRQVRLYIGVWGGKAGRIWWDDVKLQDGGLLNVLRRAGCPVEVASDKGETFTEGKDYARIEDPKLGATPWAGEYEAEHQSPSLRILPNSRIKNGQRLLVSFFHAKTGPNNQAAICLSEPKTAEVMRDELQRVADLFHPKGFFWSHDEIRVGGWCAACLKTGLTPGGILAANARLGAQIQNRIQKGSEIYVWSDMFDPFHNAVDNYYLTNGTLAKSWEGLSKDAIVVNWNSGKAKDSLSFFAHRGNRQILAGYYDSPTENFKPWLAEAAKVQGVVGVMYTTWVGNYDDLEAFAKVAFARNDDGSMPFGKARSKSPLTTSSQTEPWVAPRSTVSPCHPDKR